MSTPILLIKRMSKGNSEKKQKKAETWNLKMRKDMVSKICVKKNKRFLLRPGFPQYVFTRV